MTLATAAMEAGVAPGPASPKMVLVTLSRPPMGIWMDDHIEPLARIVRFIHEQGSAAGMQLAHAGRKASTYAPGKGHGRIPESEGGWTNVVAPSAHARRAAAAKAETMFTDREVGSLRQQIAGYLPADRLVRRRD